MKKTLMFIIFVSLFNIYFVSAETGTSLIRDYQGLLRSKIQNQSDSSNAESGIKFFRNSNNDSLSILIDSLHQAKFSTDSLFTFYKGLTNIFQITENGINLPVDSFLVGLSGDNSSYSFSINNNGLLSINALLDNADNVIGSYVEINDNFIVNDSAYIDTIVTDSLGCSVIYTDTIVTDSLRGNTIYADTIKIDSIYINKFSTDTTFAGNSDDALPTEKAVKTYIDNGAGSETVYLNQTTSTNVSIPNGLEAGYHIYSIAIYNSDGANAQNVNVGVNGTTIWGGMVDTLTVERLLFPDFANRASFDINSDQNIAVNSPRWYSGITITITTKKIWDN